MKMIKLLVLRNGKMVKLPPYAKVGNACVNGDLIGTVYAVSKDVYKNRRTSAIKKLLVDNIDSPTFTIQR